jgi:hypothetical protein
MALGACALAVVAETCAVCNVRTAGAFIINTSSSDLLFRLRRLLYSLANESELWRFDSVVEPLPAFFDGLRGRLATLTAFGTAGAAVVGNAEFCTMFLKDLLALTPSASDAAEATVIGIGEWNELRLVLAPSASDTVKASASASLENPSNLHGASASAAKASFGAAVATAAQSAKYTCSATHLPART